MSKTYLRSANGRAFLACYFADEKDLLPFYPLHSHEELEIVLVESGSADICCNGDCATVHCGDIFIVPPFSSHAIAVHDGDVKLAALVYNFRLAAGNEYVRLGQYAALFNAGRSGVLLRNGCNEKCTKIAIRIAKIMFSSVLRNTNAAYRPTLVAYNSAYIPCNCINCSCVPCSAIPSAVTTIISSAFLTVLSLCATTNVVRP